MKCPFYFPFYIDNSVKTTVLSYKASLTANIKGPLLSSQSPICAKSCMCNTKYELYAGEDMVTNIDCAIDREVVEI